MKLLPLTTMKNNRAQQRVFNFVFLTKCKFVEKSKFWFQLYKEFPRLSQLCCYWKNTHLHSGSVMRRNQFTIHNCHCAIFNKQPAMVTAIIKGKMAILVSACEDHQTKGEKPGPKAPIKDSFQGNTHSWKNSFCDMFLLVWSKIFSFLFDLLQSCDPCTKQSERSPFSSWRLNWTLLRKEIFGVETQWAHLNVAKSLWFGTLFLKHKTGSFYNVFFLLWMAVDSVPKYVCLHHTCPKLTSYVIHWRGRLFGAQINSPCKCWCSLQIVPPPPPPPTIHNHS